MRVYQRAIRERARSYAKRRLSRKSKYNPINNQVMNEEEKKVSVEMTEEELRMLEAMRRQKKEQGDRSAYKELVESAVDAFVPRYEDLSESIRQLKEETQEAFETLTETKRSVVGVKALQSSHTYMGSGNKARIIVGQYKRDGWLDTVEEGIEMVRQYMSSLAKDKDAETLVTIVLDLLSKDKQGNLSADKVLRLVNIAETSDSDLFRDGVRIIRESYNPELGKRFVRVEIKNEHGKWMAVPLSITDV